MTLRASSRAQKNAILLQLFSERERSVNAVARPSVVCRPSVTFVRPTQAVEIFGNVCTARHLIRWPAVDTPSIDIHGKFYGDRPKGTPP